MLVNISIAALMMLATTVLHIAGISIIAKHIRNHVGRWRDRYPLVRARKIGEVVVLMFFLSLVDVTGWAGIYLLVGAIDKIERALYFSTVTFTTLGYGDVVIQEGWRLMAAFEAVNGIIIFGLTTAAVVAALQRVYFAES